MTFIIGMRNPAQICARVPLRRSRSLMSAKRSRVCGSRPNAFTAWMPETVSSMCPFSAPSASCCSLYSTRVFREIERVRRKIRGTGRRLARAMNGFSAIMITSVPHTTTTPDMSCTADCDTVTLTASASLVSLLMMSPWGCMSK